MTPFIIGIIFFIVGIVFCCRFRWKRAKAYVPLVIGAFLIIISTIGPLSRANAEISRVRKLKSTEVGSIEFHPTTRKGIASIVRQQMTIIDAAAIGQICSALNKAISADENYLKNADSSCIMVFNLRDNSRLSIGIKKEGQATRVDVNSNGESGWHYAALEANELGVIIYSLAK
jgi:hypothetical protein